ncbi:hypothetical protein GP486_005303 [Trichoglossum hirsutum]|uniref:Uncharacterized protein n=1 Tax=Trichoglossum hirsutum TaxID=265104 RepID=A0A9P8L9C4_9PEZI|nr:hypothetical protein GP486_005303 [Trichoglossum hirsutum]
MWFENKWKHEFLGTDPLNHVARSPELVRNGIKFAASGTGTGLYVALSHYYSDKAPTSIELLDQLGDFKARGEGTLSCAEVAHILGAGHPVLNGLSDADLSFWSCSIHLGFVSYPKGFEALVIATDRAITGPGVVTWPDGTIGIPYILATKLKPCATCDPHPGANLCDITTTCTGTDYGTMCLCRPGFKADAHNDDQKVHWRLKWSTPGQEHRVAVTPGVVCNTLCDSSHVGPDVCEEVSVAKCGPLQGIFKQGPL